MRVVIKPEMLVWTRERAGLESAELVKKFSQYEKWESGELFPTLKQLENLANRVHAPIGYFFLSEPLKESISIPDFRTINHSSLTHPSLDVRDTILSCQQRQEWYRNFAQQSEKIPPAFVQTADLTSDPKKVANDMHRIIQFDLETRRRFRTWTEALGHFMAIIEDAGVLVMVNGVVGNNTRRKLKRKEFQGFAMADKIAPLIFVNGADYKAAQMFTLAHELAHLWLGQSALSSSRMDITKQAQEEAAETSQGQQVEIWCDKVAAEFLVPLSLLNQEYDANNDVLPESNRLARHFKVSTLVILRRLYENQSINTETYWQNYNLLKEEYEGARKTPGGDFYRTQIRRISKPFVRSVISSTLEGKTLYRDAFSLLGVSTIKHFREMAKKIS